MCKARSTNRHPRQCSVSLVLHWPFRGGKSSVSGCQSKYVLLKKVWTEHNSVCFFPFMGCQKGESGKLIWHNCASVSNGPRVATALPVLALCVTCPSQFPPHRSNCVGNKTTAFSEEENPKALPGHLSLPQEMSISRPINLAHMSLSPRAHKRRLKE